MDLSTRTKICKACSIAELQKIPLNEHQDKNITQGIYVHGPLFVYAKLKIEYKKNLLKMFKFY